MEWLWAVIVFFAYFGVDMYLALTGRDYKNISVYMVHFSRNDFKRSSDSLLFRPLRYRTSMPDLYRNRFLYWRVVFAAFAVPKDKVVVRFNGSHALFLKPLRGVVLETQAEATLCRAAGKPFTEFKCHLVIIKDQSQNDRVRILRALVIQDKDIKDFKSYLEKPPKTRGAFDVLSKVVDEYNENSIDFIPVQVVVS